MKGGPVDERKEDRVPAIPWSSHADVGSATEVVVMASRLPLKRHRSIPGFLSATMKIRGQLGRTDGLVGYALDADLVHAVFWTVSAWQNREALDQFAGQDPHRNIIAAIRSKMAPTTFTFWTHPADDLPVGWDLVRQKVSEAQSG
jgi:hypothetical protein